MRCDGMTFLQIADKLGMTRSAVAGLCRRLGLCDPTPVRPKKFKEPKVAAPKRVAPVPVEVIEEVEEEVTESVREVTEEGVTLFDLEDYMCRHMTGASRYCGARRTKGSYCAEHAKLFYVPSKPRKINSDETFVFKSKMRVNV